MPSNRTDAETDGDPARAAKSQPGRALRADARRNRARILQVAAEAFAAEGLSVSVHEIARRAGVGTGTVSRHFPAKQDLFAAILMGRMEQLTAQADALDSSADPGLAFCTLFGAVVHEGAANRGLAEALSGAGYDLDAAGASAGHDVSGRLRQLLAQAQHTGQVRADVEYADVKALMTGCLTRDGANTDSTALDRLIAVVCAGLQG